MYYDVIPLRHNYVSIFTWGVIAIVVTLALVPLGVLYTIAVRAQKLLTTSVKRRPHANVEGLPAQ
ncbi:MAG: hypothetical protein K0R82_263 [Flavipsychrobacter sp.]|jgi:hypothetical protein|nr:hypothetical protein [Flavipsychrobacter sp.]